MKKTTVVLTLILVIIISLPITLKPVVLSVAKKQLNTIFKDSVVSVGNCRIRPLHLVLFDIDIKREPIYHFVIKEAYISWRLSTLIKGRIRRIGLHNITVDIKTPKKKIAEFVQYLNLNTAKPPPFLIDRIDLLDAQFKVNAKDTRLNGSASLGLDLRKQAVRYLALNLSSLDASGIHIDDITVGAVPQNKESSLYVRQIQYDKFKIKDIGGKVILGDREISLVLLSAKVLGGEIQGDLGLTLDRNSQYTLQVQASSVDLGVIVNDFNLAEKIQMTGKLEGSLCAKGQGYDIKLLQGNFSVVKPGGTLAITDEEFLKYLAKNSQQSLDIIIESFKDYHYNVGVISLSLDKGNLILDAALDGEQGKRNVNITVHGLRIQDYLIK